MRFRLKKKRIHKNAGDIFSLLDFPPEDHSQNEFDSNLELESTSASSAHCSPGLGDQNNSESHRDGCVEDEEEEELLVRENEQRLMEEDYFVLDLSLPKRR